MSAGRAGVLLDTCAAIWLMSGSLQERVLEDILAVAAEGGLYVSPISAWEIGMLSRPRPSHAVLPQFLPDAKTWFADLVKKPGVRVAPLTTDIAIDASHLPGVVHNDPADRLLIATARNMRLSIVTRDAKIIAYGAEGHLNVIAC
jgi:PIN domain nuclease of toxin-antitoxin system